MVQLDLAPLPKSQVKVSSKLEFKTWISSCSGLETLFKSEQLQSRESGMYTKISMEEKGLIQEQHRIAQDKKQTKTANLTKPISDKSRF